jgi:hypothetical protein
MTKVYKKPDKHGIKKKKKHEQGNIRYLTRALLVTGRIFFSTK